MLSANNSVCSYAMYVSGRNNYVMTILLPCSYCNKSAITTASIGRERNEAYLQAPNERGL